MADTAALMDTLNGQQSAFLESLVKNKEVEREFILRHCLKLKNIHNFQTIINIVTIQIKFIQFELRVTNCLHFVMLLT